MNEAAEEEKKGIRVLVRKTDVKKLKDLDHKVVVGGWERLLTDFESLKVDRIPYPYQQRPPYGNGKSGVGTIHYEGDAVCQSGGDTWKDARRIVWARSPDGDSVLFLGYLPQHVDKKGDTTPEYDSLRDQAKTVPPEDFLNAVDAREAIAAQELGKESANESVDEAPQKTPFEKLIDDRDAAIELMKGVSDEEKVDLKEELKKDVRDLYETLSNNQRETLTSAINGILQDKGDLLRIVYNDVVNAIKEEKKGMTLEECEQQSGEGTIKEEKKGMTLEERGQQLGERTNKVLSEGQSCVSALKRSNRDTASIMANQNQSDQNLSHLKGSRGGRG